MSWILLVATILVALVWYLRRRNTYFKNAGIPGPEPFILFGNLLDVRNRTIHEAIQEWSKTFGKVFGYFEGGTPVLVTSDVEMMHDIFVKKFSYFHSRRAFPIQPDPDTDKKVHMFLARGYRWKRLRMISNPTFSATKLKQMVPTVNDAVDILVKVLDEKCAEGKPFDIYPCYQGMTLDVIGRCAFGFQTDCQRNANDEFLHLCREIFRDTMEPGYIVFVALLFPELRRFWSKLAFATDGIRGNPFPVLESRIREVIELRKSQPRRPDLLQLMLEAEVDDHDLTKDSLSAGAAEPASEGEMSWSVDATEHKFERKLVVDEIVSQGILFLLAGFETTSTALAYATYLLAINPEIQQKLIDEIDSRLGTKNGHAPSYEDIHKMEYLDMVLHEVLRLYPIASSVESRTCMKSCILNGVFIPQGAQIAADIWSVHYDPSIWGPEPEKFDPERFTPERSAGRHPMAWIPFGAGPRNCIGMRFALIEAKLSLVRILQNFTFVRAPETQVPLKVKEGATTTPAEGVRILLERRKR